MFSRFEINEHRLKSVSASNVIIDQVFLQTCKLVLAIWFSNRLPFVKGVTNIIGLTYKIENLGESAYLAQINISVSESISFMKTPSSCKLDKRQLLCNINNGGPLHKGQVRFLNVSLDTTNFVGTEVLVKANAMSVSDESNDEDNHVADTIPLVEFSEVEISGWAFCNANFHHFCNILMLARMSYKPLLKFQNEVQFENVSNALKVYLWLVVVIIDRKES